MTARVVALVQARMSSSRLPGKVLADIRGWPMLRWVVERARASKSIEAVVVATSDDRSDEPLARYCRDWNFEVFRGSQFDVLDRMYHAAVAASADVVVRVTADCPLIDPDLIDECVTALGGLDGVAVLDFVCNRLPSPWTRSYPMGLDVEVCTMAALARACREATQPAHREHVMPYIYDGVVLGKSSGLTAIGISPRGFRIGQLNTVPSQGARRWTVDTAEDLEFVREVAIAFAPRRDFGWRDVLALVERRPELEHLNMGIAHKSANDVDSRAGGAHSK